MPEQHRMMFIITHPDGDEFFCPDCGYGILIQWPPDYKKTVLHEGDDSALHHAGKGGLEIETDVYKTEWQRKD